MTAEIKSNAAGIADALNDLHTEQAALAHDKIVLNALIQTGTIPKDSTMNITFHIRTFDSLSWRTAVSTNALAYIPYDEAAKFADIYQEQDELAESEREAARDAAVSLGAMVGTDASWKPSKEEGESIEEKIGTLAGSTDDCGLIHEITECALHEVSGAVGMTSKSRLQSVKGWRRS